MVILGAGLNHWYHMDMNYRGIINMLVMCGCIGQEGGGWSHYVGQEKLRPQTGWAPLAFALDWNRPPRHMNSTSAWYAHTDQWRYETLRAGEILSPTAPKGDWDISLIDYNIRAERMGWLPSAPQLKTNPLEVSKAAKAAGKDIKEFVAAELKSGNLEMSCQTRMRRKTGRATCLSGGPTCLGLRARGMSISSSTFWEPTTASWARIWARKAMPSPWRPSGMTRHRRASWTCWSASTSACRRRRSIPTSCCPPRPGMKRTT